MAVAGGCGDVIVVVIVALVAFAEDTSGADDEALWNALDSAGVASLVRIEEFGFEGAVSGR